MLAAWDAMPAAFSSQPRSCAYFAPCQVALAKAQLAFAALVMSTVATDADVRAVRIAASRSDAELSVFDATCT
jgi:hypothetical protein